MKPEPTNAALVNFSVRAYQLLLVAYPPKFRQDYGPHMLQLFRDCCIRIYGREGAAGMLSLWAVTLFDFVRSVAAEHLQKETIMNKELFIRLSGWALMLGGVAFTLLFVAGTLQDSLPYSTTRLFRLYEDVIALGVFVLGPILTSIGMVGFLVRYGEAAGSLGKGILLVGAIGGITALPLAFLSEKVGAVVNIDDIIFIVVYGAGVLLMFVCLALFGIISVRRKVMPRWNWLAIVAGLWFPLMTLIDQLLADTAVLVMLTSLIFVGAMILLGYMLQADSVKKPAIA